MKAYISHDFAELETKMTVAEAQKKLAGGYGVLWDENGRFITLLKSDDLTGFSDEQALAAFLGQFPPGIRVMATQTMDAFMDNPAYSTFRVGARGVFVYENDQPIGIVTDETITRYSRNELESMGTTKDIRSDSSLAGEIIEKPLIMYCDEFKHRNELKYYNRHKPTECQMKDPHPHPIRKKAE